MMMHDEIVETVRRQLAAKQRPTLEQTEALLAMIEGLEGECQYEWVEEELRKINQTLDVLIQASPLAILTLDPAGNVQSWNPAAERIFGWNEQEVLGRPNPIVPENKQDEFRALRERVLRGETFTNTDVCRQKHDGSLIDVSISAAPLYDAKGDIISIVAMISDITERKRMERTLRFQKSLLEAQREASIDGILVVSPDRKILSFNRHFLEMWGIPEEAIATQSDEAVLRSIEDRLVNPQEFLARVAYLYAYPSEESREEIRLKDGRTFDRYSAPVTSADGVYYGRVWFFRDITERKRAETALRESEARFRAIFEGAAIGIALVDIAGRPVESNAALQAMLGYTGDELRRMSFAEFTHPDDVQPNLDLYNELVAGKRNHHQMEKRYIRKDGQVIWGHLTVSLARDAEGKPQFIFGMVEDINERKQTEAALREADRRALVEYEQLLTRLAGLAQAVGTARDLTMVFRALFDFVIVSAPTNGLFASLYDPELQERTCVFAWSEGQEIDVSMLPPMPISNSPHSRAVATGQIIVTDDLEAALAGQPRLDLAFDLDPRPPRSSIAVPMAVMGQVIGGFEVQSLEAAAYSEEHVTALRMAANLAAIAIQNVRLLERERQLRLAAQASEERFRATFDQAAVGIAHSGMDGKWLLVNQRLCDIVGYTQAEMLERSFHDITHPDDLDADLEHTRQLLAGEIESYSMEKRYKRKDGSTAWVNLTVSLVCAPSGAPKYFIAVVEDISERKRAEAALRESEQRFRILFEQSPDAILLFDPHDREVLWRIVDSNPAASRINGYPREELIGQGVHLLSVGEPDPEGCAAYIERLRREGPVHSETTHRRKDGSLFQIEFSTSLITVGGRELVMGVDRDITERKRMEAVLREREERYRAVVEQSSEGIFLVDADTKYLLEANAAYQELLGYTAEEILGLTLYDVVAHDRASIDYYIQRIFQEQCYFIGERRHRRKDGSLVDVETSGSIISCSGRKVLCVVVRDITERKRAEEEHERLLEQLKEAEVLREIDRLKSEFIANVSHELRTPLHHIKGYATTLLRLQIDFDRQTTQDYLRIIVEEGDKLERLIVDLLETSRIEAGALSLDIESVQIDELVYSAVQRWQGVGTHRFEAQLPAEVPPVPADARRITQVLDNLLGNVVQHTPENTLAVIDIQLTRKELIVSVCDDGPGVAVEHLSHLFDRFYQADLETYRQRRGNGLGLFICKGIVEQHGGRIWAELTPGTGLTFRFSLPRRRKAISI